MRFFLPLSVVFPNFCLAAGESMK